MRKVFRWALGRAGNLVDSVGAGIRAVQDSWDASYRLEYLTERLKTYERDGYMFARTYGPVCSKCGCETNAASTAIWALLDELKT